jgi:hypothetical protein
MIRDGQIVSGREYETREEALEARGFASSACHVPFPDRARQLVGDGSENAVFSGDRADSGVTVSVRGGTVARMVDTALRPIGQLAAWLVWQATRISLLADLEQPRPPHVA